MVFTLQLLFHVCLGKRAGLTEKSQMWAGKATQFMLDSAIDAPSYYSPQLITSK